MMLQLVISVVFYHCIAGQEPSAHFEYSGDIAPSKVMTCGSMCLEKMGDLCAGKSVVILQQLLIS